jgi:2-polyprenyl-3-methyl-5-hydroxy-6-metoxy-1,4-benzoquinol methylase
MKEEGPEYYTRALLHNRHYASVIWYIIYVLIADRLPTDARILDLGCGQGFLAHCLKDWGFNDYIGVDFCEEALLIAKDTVPEFTFFNYDLNKPGWENLDYDTVVSTEFVEHVEGDLEILAKIRPGTRVLLSTTNVLVVGHVRAFASSRHVAGRYGHLFEEGFTVTPFLGNHFRDLGWQYFYILDGIRGKV